MILYLTTADTDLLTLRSALDGLPDEFPAIRTANVTDWEGQDEAAHAFLDAWLHQARVVVLRLLGGKRAHPAAFERIVSFCQQRDIPLLAWPGDQEPVPELLAATNVPLSLSQQAMLYAVYGGVKNFRNLFRMISDTWLGTAFGYEEPAELPWTGIYRKGSLEALDYTAWRKTVDPERPVVGILFYRAHWMSHNLSFVDDLVDALDVQGYTALPIFTQSLKVNPLSPDELSFLQYLLDEQGQARVDALIVTLSFASSAQPAESEWLKRLDVPVFQAIVSLQSREHWENSDAGISPLDTAMNVAMPEMDGRIMTVPFSFKESVRDDPVLGCPLRRYETVPDRVDFLVRLVSRWIRLRRKPRSARKIAFLLTNYPHKNSRIGNAVGLDTPNSLVRILFAMAERGYDLGDVDDLPRDGDALIQRLVARCSNDRDALSEAQLAQAEGHLDQATYQKRWEAIPADAQEKMKASWGEPPGDVFVYREQLVIPGIRFGNVFVGLQPPRGFGDNPVAVYHSPDLVPTHHYVGYYQWLRDVFQADAVVHVGKHGTLEWLPGKGTGLSKSCFPEVVLDDLPNFYPYIINNPGEGTQAKRRSHATIVSHLVPVPTTADAYDALAKLEQLLDEYAQMQVLDPKKLPLIEQEIWETVIGAHLDKDLQVETYPDDFEAFIGDIDGYICELKSAQIRDGLHILGQLPEDEAAWADLLYGLLQLPAGGRMSLPEAVAKTFEVDWQALQADLGRKWAHDLPFGQGIRTAGDVREWVVRLAKDLLKRAVIRPALGAGPDGAEDIPLPAPLLDAGGPAAEVAAYAREELLPRLLKTPDEIAHLLHGLDGRFVPPGPSGSPTRGMPDILPTGRNFYSVDPRSLPSPAAWKVGKQLAEALIARYLKEEGRYPETVGIVVWGTSAMRTRGDDVAEILALLGVRPVWQQESRRVSGLEVIPLAELGRPRVDVTVRISGFFRDAFANLVHLINQAVEMVSRLDEPEEMNPLARHVREETAAKVACGLPEAEARKTSLFRVFGSKPGTYGSGLLPLIESRRWRDEHDLARVFTTWSGYAYTKDHYGKPAAAEFQNRLKKVQVATKNQDNREHDIFDSDDYFQEHGGMVAAIRALTGTNPKMYFGDSAHPGHVRMRALSEEARRVFRTRVVNPKWLAAVRRHGYKGALEMANTVDFLFGYDATAGVIDDWMYEQLSRAYVLDPAMQEFFRQSNPWALKEIAERLLEAAHRRLWQQPRPETLQALAEALLAAEGWTEERSGRRKEPGGGSE